MQLHGQQEKLLKLLKNNASDPLSIRELQEEIDAKSPSVVQHHLKQLEKKGYLKRNPNDPRDYQILAEPDSEITYLNMYGMAQCGSNGRLLDGEVLDRVPIYSPILGFPASEGFLVKARGDSMKPYIHGGDMVIARRTSNIKNNDVAICVNNGEVLIKRVQAIYNKDNTISYNLISLNSKVAPFVASDDFHVEGVVKSVLKYSV